MLNKLPKELLIKLISHIEDDLNQKYSSLSKSFQMLINLIGPHRFEQRTCNHNNCKEYCFIYSTSCGCDCEGDIDYISTSQNIETGELGEILIDDGNDYDPKSNDHFHQYGVACNTCRAWFCTNHWLDHVEQIESPIYHDGGLVTFCKKCKLDGKIRLA